ncbi:hypothetical protein ACTRW9_03585 [Nitrospina sp. 32_T5]|uniref:hypothetical protein n=1 Tax=unclassified Nitrospina TaxID=2638683 RepID=UPI003F99D85B
MEKPTRRIIPPLMGMTALGLGLYFLARLYLDDFPRNINVYWDYFWLNWQVMLIASCWISAYGLLLPRLWGWFFAQLTLVVFYFGYVYLKMVFLGVRGMGWFYLFHFTVFAAAIAFLQHPDIYTRFIDETVKLKRPRRHLRNVGLTILFVGLVPMVTGFVVALNFPQMKTSPVAGVRTPLDATPFLLPMGYRILLPEGTRMVDVFHVRMDSETFRTQRQNILKQGFLHYDFTLRAMALQTPDGTQVFLQDRTFVQSLLGSLSAASYFHHLNYKATELELGRKWHEERMGLLFVMERGLELDFQFRLRSEKKARHIPGNQLDLFTESYVVQKGERRKRVQLFHVYRRGLTAGGGMFTGPVTDSFNDLLGSIAITGTGHPAAEEYYRRGVDALLANRVAEAGLALGSALFLFDADPRYHTLFAHYQLSWPGGVTQETFDRAVLHLQQALNLDPDFEPAWQMAENLGLRVRAD